MHRLHRLRGKFRLSKSGRSITTGNALDSSFRMEFHSEKYPFLVLPITAAFFVFLQEAELRGFMLTLTSEATSFRRNWQSHEIPHPATRFLPGPILPLNLFIAPHYLPDQFRSKKSMEARGRPREMRAKKE